MSTRFLKELHENRTTRHRETIRAGIPYMGGTSGLPRTCKGLFTHITQALNIDDTDPEERKVTQATIPGLVVDLRVLPECAQGIAMGNLSGGRHTAS